jgi:hypothetical protein
MEQKSNRCFVCKRKLNLVEQTAGICKCNQVFCARHKCVRDASTTDDRCHPCSFDYLKEQKQLLQRQNPVVKYDKLPMV